MGGVIFAAASGAGRGAIQVVRLSGAGCGDIIRSLAGRLPPARRAVLCALRAKAAAPDQAGEILDQALVLWFPGPASYTGEDSAELHLHGGRAVLQAVSRALLALGARPAEPGEFTRRAFINQRMDLLAAEAVGDLVAAETEAQRRQAMRMLQGAQSARVAGWAERLRTLLAWQEALIDFPDEDLPAEVDAALQDGISTLLAAIEQAIAASTRGQRLRDGLVIAITGAPNVGKSSLVNALAGSEIAIVTDLPGTTRDVLEARLDLDGIAATLLDTAGLRDTEDPVEAEGVRRARARAAEADVVVEVIAADAPGAADLRQAGQGRADAAYLLVANKIDLAPCPPGALGVSAAHGTGMEALRAWLVEAARRLAHGGTDIVLSHARHSAALRDAANALAAAQQARLPELRGEELRLAMAALGRITGTVDVEALLDTVFSSFCIGK